VRLGLTSLISGLVRLLSSLLFTLCQRLVVPFLLFGLGQFTGCLGSFVGQIFLLGRQLIGLRSGGRHLFAGFVGLFLRLTGCCFQLCSGIDQFLFGVGRLIQARVGRPNLGLGFGDFLGSRVDQFLLLRIASLHFPGLLLELGRHLRVALLRLVGQILRAIRIGLTALVGLGFFNLLAHILCLLLKLGGTVGILLVALLGLGQR